HSGRQEPRRNHARRGRQPDRGARREDRRQACAAAQGPAQGGRPGRKARGGSQATARQGGEGHKGREADEKGRGEIKESPRGSRVRHTLGLAVSPARTYVPLILK